MTEGRSHPERLDPYDVFYNYFNQRGCTAIAGVGDTLDSRRETDPAKPVYFKLNVQHPQKTHLQQTAVCISVVKRPHVDLREQSLLLELAADELHGTAVTANDIYVLLLRILWSYRVSKVQLVKLNDM